MLGQHCPHPGLATGVCLQAQRPTEESVGGKHRGQSGEQAHWVTHHRLHVVQCDLLPEHHLVKGSDEES